jgi:hypothetical protein
MKATTTARERPSSSRWAMLRRKKPVLLNLEAPEAPRTVPQKLGETRFHAKKKMQGSSKSTFLFFGNGDC